MNRKLISPGSAFGRLTVIRLAGTKRACLTYECVCSCGVTREVLGTTLRSGDSTSCGCSRKGNCGVKPIHGHGKPGDRTYAISRAAKVTRLIDAMDRVLGRRTTADDPAKLSRAQMTAVLALADLAHPPSHLTIDAVAERLIERDAEHLKRNNTAAPQETEESDLERRRR